jgi:uncharacterized Zn finger protein
LQRGRDYYADGRVIDLEEIDTGYWLVTVQGTDTYYAAISGTSDGALFWTCSCPYDWGPVCKHAVAALYALEATGAAPPPETSKPRKKRKTRTDKIREAIGALSKDELAGLLLEMARDDRALAHLILARYGPDKGNKGAYARLVQDALRPEQDRHGFLDYWSASRAARGVNELLDRADARLAGGQGLEEAISIYQAVEEEVVPAMAHADDSMGMLGDCIGIALAGLQGAAEALPPAEREAIFDYCVARAPEEPYAEWDWGWDLAGIAAELLETPQQQAALFAALDQMAYRHENEVWGADYDRERAATIKLSVIRRRENDAAVEAFLEAHIQYERLRMALARFHLDNGDLAAARRLCEEWLERPPADKPGLRPYFLDVLLDVAEAAGDEEEQIRLAEALFQQRGDFGYYERLKALIGADAWPDYRSGFIQRIQQGRRGWFDMGALYIAEEMWETLLEYVQADPHAAPYYHEHLATRFPQELSEAYEQLALDTLGRKVNRRGYQEACGYLQYMQRLGQNERVAELVAQFREQYKKRPALLDELNKAFGR